MNFNVKTAAAQEIADAKAIHGDAVTSTLEDTIDGWMLTIRIDGDVYSIVNISDSGTVRGF